MTSNKLTTVLWFDRDARQAAEFYARTFDACTKDVVTHRDAPLGAIEAITRLSRHALKRTPATP